MQKREEIQLSRNIWVLSENGGCGNDLDLYLGCLWPANVH